MFIEPILLTAAGDTLTIEEDSGISDKSVVGGHSIWHGAGKYQCERIKMVSVSDTHYRLVCEKCGTLLVVSLRIKTYGELRAQCEKDIQERKFREQAIDDAICATARIG